MKRLTFRLICLFLTISLAGCKNSTKSVIQLPGYPLSISNIFQEKCVHCHNQQNSQAGLRLDSWDELIKGSNFGEAIIPFDTSNSLMLELLTKRAGGVHPTEKGGTALSQSEITTLNTWIKNGAINQQGTVPYQNSQNRLYVCSQGEAIINVIDTEALLVIRNINLTNFDLLPNAKPHHIAFSPDGKFLFVSCIEADKVLKIDTDSYEKVLDASTKIPALLDHHAKENILYISRFMDPNNPNSIHLLNSETMLPAAKGVNGDILLPPSLSIPHAIALDSSGQYAFTSSLTADEFIIIKHQDGSYLNSLTLGRDRQPLQIAVAPDNQSAYLSCIGTGEALVIDIKTPEKGAIIQDSIALGGKPWHGIFHPDGSKFYIGNSTKHQFSVIETSDGSFQEFGQGNGQDGLSEPHGIAISPDGQRLFISNRNTQGKYSPRYNLGDNANIGTVVVINTRDNSIEKVLEIENFGSGMRLWSQ